MRYDRNAVKKFMLAVGFCLIVAIAWYLISPIWRVKIADDVSPVSSSSGGSSMSAVIAEDHRQAQVHVLAEASFVPGAHAVEGKALLIEQSGKHILRFENFDTINGPDLHIYLATGLGGKPYVDLGPIRATHGNVNYELDDSIDLSTYRTVLVWCQPFGVLFSSASL